jgi:serine/threonine protein kinase
MGIILYEILRGKSMNLKDDAESIEILASNIGISKSEASLFRANHNCKYPSKEYKDLWSHANRQLGDLCMRMLSFNPEYRISFAECLQHPVFKDIKKI